MLVVNVNLQENLVFFFIFDIGGRDLILEMLILENKFLIVFSFIWIPYGAYLTHVVYEITSAL